MPVAFPYADIIKRRQFYLCDRNIHPTSYNCKVLMATRYTYSCYVTSGQSPNFSGSQLILLPTGATDTISLLHRLVGRFKHVIYEKHCINYKELSYLLLLNKVKKTAIKRVGIDSKKLIDICFQNERWDLRNLRFLVSVVLCLISKCANQC